MFCVCGTSDSEWNFCKLPKLFTVLQKEAVCLLCFL